jgi:DNA ligase (NAD+)
MGCPAQAEGRLFHWASKPGFDIDGLGEKLARQLLSEKLINNPADLYFLARDKLLPLELMAEKKADNLLAAVDRSRSRPLPNVIHAFGINGVGEAAATLLAESFGTIDKLAAASQDDLEEIDGIGPTIARTIWQFFQNDGNRKMLDRLREGGVRFEPYRSSRTAGALAGKSFVITGTLSKPRNHFKNLVEQAGGKVTGSVSGKTDFLLAGADAGSKLEKARKLGTKIVSEDDLARML